MSGKATYNELEAKRQEMIASFKTLSSAMAHCVDLVNAFVAISPSSVPAASTSPLTIPAVIPTIANSTVPATLSETKPAKAAKKKAAVEGQAFTAAGAGAAALDPSLADDVAVGPKKRGRKPTKEKKPKDPYAPKRPPSAYLLYQNVRRPQLGPNIAYKDAMNVVAEEWKVLADDEKEEYNGAYKLANARWHDEDLGYRSDPARWAQMVQSGDAAGMENMIATAKAIAAAGGTIGRPAYEPAPVGIAIAAGAGADDSDDDSDSDSDDDDDEDEPARPPPAKKQAVPAQMHMPQTAAPQQYQYPQQQQQQQQAAVPANVGTEKKKKSSGEEGGEKKKKKKDKLAAA